MCINIEQIYTTPPHTHEDRWGFQSRLEGGGGNLPVEKRERSREQPSSVVHVEVSKGSVRGGQDAD